MNNIICINKKEIMNSHEIAVDDVHCEQCKAYMRLEKSESGTIVKTNIQSFINSLTKYDILFT